MYTFHIRFGKRRVGVKRFLTNQKEKEHFLQDYTNLFDFLCTQSGSQPKKLPYKVWCVMQQVSSRYDMDRNLKAASMVHHLNKHENNLCHQHLIIIALILFPFSISPLTVTKARCHRAKNDAKVVKTETREVPGTSQLCPLIAYHGCIHV